jgi:hypothetical protein
MVYFSACSVSRPSISTCLGGARNGGSTARFTANCVVGVRGASCDRPHSSLCPPETRETCWRSLLRYACSRVSNFVSVTRTNDTVGRRCRDRAVVRGTYSWKHDTFWLLLGAVSGYLFARQGSPRQPRAAA